MIIAFTILVYIAAASSVLALDDPDLVFYFPYENFNGDIALDQSGKGHNGSINGNIKLVDGGKRGKAGASEKALFASHQQRVQRGGRALHALARVVHKAVTREQVARVAKGDERIVDGTFAGQKARHQGEHDDSDQGHVYG